MISFIRCLKLALGKRGEFRYGNILPAPKPSSLCRVLKYLSSRVLLKMSSHRAVTRVQAIFELMKKKIGSFLDVFGRKRGMTSLKDWLGGMTVLMIVFSLFLLFPLSTNSAVHFLPDVQSEEILSSPPIASIDSMRCEEVGYTYYSSGTCPAYHNQEICVFHDKYLKCDSTGWCMDNGYATSSCSSPKILDTQCPNNLALYKTCTCPSDYEYTCSGTGYSSGNGTVCDSKYTKCNCSTNYVWSGSACVCDSAFKYTCSGTGYSSGSGVACGGKYKSCNCSTYYSWNGSSCVHTHSYVCPSGSSTSKSGMITPVSVSKVCALSGCSSTSGTCYKEGHTHSYSCPSGYSTSCSNGYSGTASKRCSCGTTSGTCYACCASTYKYTCSGTGYSGGSGSSCNGKYTTCSCASGYIWNGSACVRNCPVGYFYYTNGSCGTSNNGSVAGIVIQANTLVVGVVVYTGSWYEAPNLCYYHNPGIGYGQWFVPTSGDLYNYVHFNYSFLSAWLPEGEYWGSTEHSSDMGLGRVIGGNYAGYTYAVSKNNILYIACVLSI